MDIDSKMEYAIDLADLDFCHEFEDLFKLASLCDEIEKLRISGISATPRTEELFSKSIKRIFEKRGSFRAEVENFPLAKQLIKGI